MTDGADVTDERQYDPENDRQGKDARSGWMIDKKIPLALLVTIIFQTAILSAWFASFKATTESDIAQIKKEQTAFSDTKVVERLVRIETLMEGQKEILARVENSLSSRRP